MFILIIVWFVGWCLCLISADDIECFFLLNINFIFDFFFFITGLAGFEFDFDLDLDLGLLVAGFDGDFIFDGLDISTSLSDLVIALLSKQLLLQYCLSGRIVRPVLVNR